MFALEIPWKLKVKPWVVLPDATRLGSFSPFFQANQRNLIGDSHLPFCPAKAKGDGEPLYVKKDNLRPVPWWSDPSLMQVNCSSLTSTGGECCHSLLPFLVIHHPTLWQKSCCSEICCVRERTAIWNEPDSCLILPVSSLFRKSQRLRVVIPPIFPPSLKTLRSSCHVIHVAKSECRAWMNL